MTLTKIVRGYAPLSLALLSSVLFMLSLPPHNAEGLGWFALAPLLFAAARLPRTLWAFGLGALTGVAAGMMLIGFRGPTGSLNYAYVPFIWIAFVLGMTSAFAQWMRQGRFGKGAAWVLAVACAGVAAEWLTHLSPLPVGIALCQYQMLPVIQIASFTGIWGVSFLLYAMNAGIADIALNAAAMPKGASSGTIWADKANRGFIVALLLCSANLYYGCSITPVRYSTVKVAAIQDFNGIESKEKDPFAPVAPDDLPDTAALIRQAAKDGAQIIVGTENACGYSFTPDEPRSEMNKLARETGRYLVIGHEMNAQPLPFNCGSLISPEGKTLGTHHKIALFLGERQMMQPGSHATVVNTPLGKIGLLICFDTCYTTYVRQAALAGARLIAIPNYDPPTPNAALHNLHAAVVPFRAVENHVALVRADPNGKSQIISPDGLTMGEAPMYETCALTRGVSLADGKGTFFTRWGDWFAYLCVAGTALPFILTGIRGKDARIASFPH